MHLDQTTLEKLKKFKNEAKQAIQHLEMHSLNI